MDDSFKKLIDDFITSNIKNINIEYIKIIRFIIKESNKLNLSKEEIYNNIETILLEYKISDNEFKDISNNLINTLFNNSKIKKIKKITHINNITTINRNLNEILKKFIHENDITVDNFMNNINNILDFLLENLHKYDFGKNKPSIIIYKVIDERLNILLKDKMFLFDNNLIRTIVIEYIDLFIELDKDESNILSNNIKKKLCLNIFKCLQKHN